MAYDLRDLGPGLLEGQVPEAEALARLKSLLEDASVLKIGHDLKPLALLLGRHGIGLAPYDDTILLAYTLDAGRSDMALASLADRWLSHTPLGKKDVMGSGRGAGSLSSRSTARGLSTSIPCAASPPSAFCQLKVPTSIFAQSMCCANAAEVASQIVRPVRSAAIQLASGTRTPLVVPFQVKTISLAESIPWRSAISP